MITAYVYKGDILISIEQDRSRVISIEEARNLIVDLNIAIVQAVKVDPFEQWWSQHSVPGCSKDTARQIFEAGRASAAKETHVH